MNQSINTDSKNSKEPQQKYRLGTVSIKILGGLNRFYGHPTSPSASIMAQNIQAIMAKNLSWLKTCLESLSWKREHLVNATNATYCSRCSKLISRFLKLYLHYIYMTNRLSRRFPGQGCVVGMSMLVMSYGALEKRFTLLTNISLISVVFK